MDYNEELLDLLKDNEDAYIEKTERTEGKVSVNASAGIKRYRVMINDMAGKIENEKHLKRIYDLAEYFYVGGD